MRESHHETVLADDPRVPAGSLPTTAGAQPAVTGADFDPLIVQLQAAAREFTRDALRPGVTAAVVQARFVVPLEDRPEGPGYELLVEVFTERANEGRLQTWQLDVVEDGVADAVDGSVGWRIADQRNLNTVEGLYHLTLTETTQYDAANLVIAGEDLTLQMREGSVFVVEQRQGVTGLVLIGDGLMTFSPQPEAERSQVRIFAGRDTLEADFTDAFVRLNPRMFASRVSTGALEEVPVDDDALELALQIFDEFAPLSFAVDLSDLSDKNWWLTPGVGSFIGDIRTRRHGTLTYVQAQNRPEDISLFDRSSQRIIALYSSARNRAARGRYFSDRDVVLYDVLDYDIQAAFDPQGYRQDSLRAQPELGTDLTLVVRYSGLLPAPAFDENWIGRQRHLYDGLTPFGIGEPRYVYSNTAYWYPQSTVTDYATATMDLTVPADYGVVASGEPDEGNPPVGSVEGATGVRRYSFVTLQPTRYLSCIISRFVPEGDAAREVPLDDEVLASAFVRSGVSYDSVSLRVTSNERTRERIDELSEKSADILRFYTRLIGDVPYPTFTLALTDSDLPGGHSPAYFAVLNQPLPRRDGLMVSWRTDPVAFSGYPSFFLAHELAHQWWGQARSLESFFERWIHDSDLPELRFAYHTESRISGQPGETDVVLTFEQGETLFEVPITGTLRYRDGRAESVVVPVTEQLTEVRVPIRGRLRDVKVNEDQGALAEIER